MHAEAVAMHCMAPLMLIEGALALQPASQHSYTLLKTKAMHYSST